MADLMPTHESRADCTSPTRLPTAPTASGYFALIQVNGPLAAPCRIGWGLKPLGSFCASRASAACTSGKFGVALITDAPQLS